jgi:ribosomal protein S18 acetylase RimI-like enzyme
MSFSMDILMPESFTSDIALALEANLQAHVSLYARLPGAIVCSEPGVVGLMTNLDVSESCVYQANIPLEEASRKIGQVLKLYRTHGCLPMWWLVGPSTQPSNLGTYLKASGFRCIAQPPGMFVDLQDLENQKVMPENFIVERVTTSEQLMYWTEIVQVADGITDALRQGFYSVFSAQNFDSEDHNQLFLGLVDGVPVATSRLFCAGGVAGIYHVATLPVARSKGYGTAMTLAAAHAGQECSYYFGILFATTAGIGIYRQLGFQEHSHFEVFQSPQ